MRHKEIQGFKKKIKRISVEQWGEYIREMLPSKINIDTNLPFLDMPELDCKPHMMNIME